MAVIANRVAKSADIGGSASGIRPEVLQGLASLLAEVLNANGVRHPVVSSQWRLDCEWALLTLLRAAREVVPDRWIIGLLAEVAEGGPGGLRTTSGGAMRG